MADIEDMKPEAAIAFDPINKYSILQELDFNLGLAKRYAVIVEHRLGNGMDCAPYMDLLNERIENVAIYYGQLAKILEFNKKEAA